MLHSAAPAEIKTAQQRRESKADTLFLLVAEQLLNHLFASVNARLAPGAPREFEKTPEAPRREIVRNSVTSRGEIAAAVRRSDARRAIVPSGYFPGK